MPINSQRFNSLIGFRQTLTEMQKIKICCPECEQKIQAKLNEIQDYLESDCEIGVVTPD